MHTNTAKQKHRDTYSAAMMNNELLLEFELPQIGLHEMYEIGEVSYDFVAGLNLYGVSSILKGCREGIDFYFSSSKKDIKVSSIIMS